MAAAASHLCNMPDEVIHTIVAKLDDMRAVLRLSQTSRWFASRTSRPELWGKLLQDSWGEATVAELEAAASCLMTCYARTRLVPTVHRDAVETAMEPELFVPAPLSEYRILVEIMHEDRVVCAQAVQLATDKLYLELDLSQHGLPLRDGDRPAFPSCAPAAGVPH
jgi:hypothetical protein